MTVEDALAHDLEKGARDDVFPDDDDDDESYKADEGEVVDNVIGNNDEKPHNWDDEENIKSITEGDLADCVQSSADAASVSSPSIKQNKAASAKAASVAGDQSMDEADIAAALNNSVNKEDNDSSLGAGSLLRRKEAEEQQQARLRAAKKKKKQVSAAARFMDLEADLGSDNEENDDRIKQINRGDLEEDENGMDDSLDGFVEHGALAGDNEEIEEGNEAARALYMERCAEDERNAIKDTMGAVFYGKNKKRKRGEIELDDLDEQQKMIDKRREERL